MSNIYIQLIIFICIFIDLPLIYSNRITSKSTYIVNDLQDVNLMSNHGNSVDKSNISNYLWHLFQNRNINSYQMEKPILYYTPNTNNEISNNTSMKFNKSKPLQFYHNLQTSGNVNIFQRLKNDPVHIKAEMNSNLRITNQMIQPNQLTIFPNQIPLIPNERPFHNHVLLKHNEMIRLLGGQNFNSEFMSFNKPWEAIMFPSGRLISSTFINDNKNTFETLLSLNRNRRSRKIKSKNHQNFLNIYDSYKKRKKHNHIDTNLNQFFQNIMHRLKLIENLKYKNQFNDQLLHFQSNQQYFKYNRMKKNRQLKRILREFLNDYNNCPLYYIWYDLGSKFWPRWIKTGQCVNLANTSCSLPPGMYCQEKNTKNIAILRYICPEKWPLSKCNWYRVHLPIVTECSCQCTSKSTHKKDS
ncbi:uncharacterized protein DC041_0009809 [Schistosoma bovis]|uniref:Noggin n=1 Tax=Schistosoma bovis TaxID=6184 RepID=A0A430QFC3_SCHBO|nr:uncharacterized protein DC041_0009809 [Schistosoma bovis]CAH8604654.1 unnamed protein product [Schistosoma bovis]